MKPHFALGAAALLFSTSIAHAQVQTDCHTNSVQVQLTNFTRTTSLPKFDPSLGQLMGVEIRVAASVEGSARIESLDAEPSLVSTQFAVDITLRQDDASVTMLMVPIADFLDSLQAFDGVVDFGGTSGITHAGIQAADGSTVVVPMTPKNLALFRGPGMIDFVADAAGSSLATGAGNLQTQFETRAGIDVQVCYTFLGNNPPVVNCPGPLMASVGVPVQFDVCATDPDAGDVVTLNGVLPAGAVANPPFPVVGNPACTTITWTPQSDQIGDNPFVFTANDALGDTATCTTVVGTAECHMIFGVGSGLSSTVLFGHLYDTQLAGVRMSYPVTMVDHPSWPLQALPQVVTMQVLMYNPQIFPNNASQWSHALQVVRHPDLSITTTHLGTSNGINVQAELFQDGMTTRIRFPFSILGM